ncbi:MAG: hypothetical protein Tsb0020_14470 [Haliangiales bacterium]
MTRLIGVFAAFGLFLTVDLATNGAAIPDVVAHYSAAPTAADCNARNNLGEVADKFISRCRKGSIRREFPSQYLSKTLKVIKGDSSADGKKAWKLLNDNRFKK